MSGPLHLRVYATVIFPERIRLYALSHPPIRPISSSDSPYLIRPFARMYPPIRPYVSAHAPSRIVLTAEKKPLRLTAQQAP